jgi:hypothetical protein
LSDFRKCRRFQAAVDSKLPFTERRFHRCRSHSSHHIHASRITCRPYGINQS